MHNQPIFRFFQAIALVLIVVFSTGLSAEEYRIPLDSEPVTLDPALYTDIYSFNVANSIYDGLVEFDKDLQIKPAIAKRWKISRDQTAYTFELLEGVTFHNGRKVVAEDFVFSFTRLLDPVIRSPVASLFMEIKGAKAFFEGKADSVAGLRAPDPHTFEIELVKPFAPFLSILAMINAKVVPKEAVGGNFGKNPIGTGPFRFETWEDGKQIVLKANKSYFGGPVFLDKLRFKIYQNLNWEKIFADFKTGALDQSIIPSDQYDRVTEGEYRRLFNIVSKPGLNLVYIGINSGIKPFDDRRVRQALIYATDREKIVREITKRGSVPARGILPPGIAGFDPKFDAYPYDPGMAAALLKQAGFPNGNGFPPVEIWTVSKSESVKNEILAYKQYLEAVGIRVTPKVAGSWKEFIDLINSKKVPLFYMAWYADYADPDNFLHVLCHSQSKTNRMGYINPKVDELLEKGRSKAEYMERVRLYRDVEKIVKSDAPMICQHINSFHYIFQPWVENLNMSCLGPVYLPFKDIRIERKPGENK